MGMVLLIDYIVNGSKTWRVNDSVDVAVPEEMFYEGVVKDKTAVRWKPGKIKSLGYHQMIVKVEFDDYFKRTVPPSPTPPICAYFDIYVCCWCSIGAIAKTLS
jgi:hypothetical protein